MTNLGRTHDVPQEPVHVDLGSMNHFLRFLNLHEPNLGLSPLLDFVRGMAHVAQLIRTQIFMWLKHFR